MPGNELATIPEGQGTDLTNLNMKQIFWLGDQMALAGIASGNKAAAQASLKIMAGQALGIDPVSAQRGIFFMPSGSIGFMANLVAARIKANPKYDYKVITLTDEVCIITFYDVDKAGKKTEAGTETFGQKDAARQGTQNMQKFPKNMLFARAISNGSKFYCPDVMGDYPIYTEGDAGQEQIVTETGEVKTGEEVHDEAAAAAEERRQKAAMAGKRMKPGTAAPKEPETPPAAPSEPTPAPENHESKSEPATAPESPESEQVPANDNEPAEIVDESTPDVNESAGFGEEGPFDPHTEGQRKKIMAMLNELGFKSDAEKKGVYTGLTTHASFKDLSKSDAEKLIEQLQEALDKEGGAEGLRMFFVTEALNAE